MSAIVDVIAGSTDPQLTTTGAVKAALGLGATSTQYDSVIDTYITQASRWADSYVGYPLSAQRYREYTPSYGTRNLSLSNMPVRAVPNGPFSGDDTGTASEVESSEMRVNRPAGMLDRDAGWWWTAPFMPRPFAYNLTDAPFAGQERPMWMTDYVAGYTYGGISTDSDLWSTRCGTTSTGRTLPEDIERGVVMRVVQLFQGRDGIAEKAVGDLRVRYSSFGSESTPGPARAALDPYRRF